jgi:hypothetical protein
MTMNSKDISKHINDLVNEEHALLQRGEEDGGLNVEEKARMAQLEVELDQCWDLLRQRRARRHAGQDPNQAHLRDAGTVENYKQ